jgi:hypothetical protein
MADLASRERWVSRVGWLARGWAVLTVGLVLAFLVGEGFHPSRLQAREWLGLAFFPVGICVGMIVAWRHELAGGLITVGSLAAFYVIHFVTAGIFPRGWAFLVFAAPGFIFVLTAVLRERARSKEA